MQESFWWWHCSDRQIISLFPHPQSPVLNRPKASVDVSTMKEERKLSYEVELRWGGRLSSGFCLGICHYCVVHDVLLCQGWGLKVCVALGQGQKTCRIPVSVCRLSGILKIPIQLEIKEEWGTYPELLLENLSDISAPPSPRPTAPPYCTIGKHSIKRLVYLPEQSITICRHSNVVWLHGITVLLSGDPDKATPMSRKR